MRCANEFWEQVDRSSTAGCWPWLGGSRVDNRGERRGALRWNGRVILAYRVAWELEHGSPPSPDKLVCHHCDNPICVRPSHLFIGTVSDNMRDMYAKGRHPKRGGAYGIRHHAASLTDSEIMDALDLVASGMSLAAVARLVGVDAAAVAKWHKGATRKAAHDAWRARRLDVA